MVTYACERPYARDVLGEGTVRLLRSAGFAVGRQPPAGAAPMQFVVGRVPRDMAVREPYPPVFKQLLLVTLVMGRSFIQSSAP